MAFFQSFRRLPSTIPSVSLISSIIIISLFLPYSSSVKTIFRTCSTYEQGPKCMDPNANCVLNDSKIGFCKCSQGFHFVLSLYPYCIKPIAIGGTCLLSVECQLSDPNSYCSSGANSRTCQCNNGHRFNFRKQCEYNSSKLLNQSVRLVTSSSGRRFNLITPSSPKIGKVSRYNGSISPTQLEAFRTFTFTRKNTHTEVQFLLSCFIIMVAAMVTCGKLVNRYNRLKPLNDSIQDENLPSSLEPLSIISLPSQVNSIASGYRNLINTTPLTDSITMNITINELEHRANGDICNQFSSIYIPTSEMVVVDDDTSHLLESLPADELPPSYDQVASSFSIQVENWK